MTNWSAFTTEYPEVTAYMIGLGNVDDTSDANKPLSDAAIAALALKQPLDSDLTAIAALTTTTVGRSLLAAIDAAALRTILGLGTAATSATSAFDAAGAASAAQAASQPLDSDLTSIAALTTTSYGRAFLALADAAAARTYMGVDAAGVNQPLDSDLTAIAALTTNTYGRSLLTMADAAATKTSLSLNNVNNTSDAAKTFTASQLVSGVLAIGRLATGTPDGTKFVRDDGTLAVPPGSGGSATKWRVMLAGQLDGSGNFTAEDPVLGVYIANDIDPGSKVLSFDSTNGITNDAGIYTVTSGTPNTFVRDTDQPAFGDHVTYLDNFTSAFVHLYVAEESPTVSGGIIFVPIDNPAWIAGGGGGATIGSSTPQALGSATPGATGFASDMGHVHAMPAISSLGGYGNAASATIGISTGNVLSATSTTTYGRALLTLADRAAMLTLLALTATDIPALAASKITSGTVDTARLGSGTASAATALFGDQTYKRTCEVVIAKRAAGTVSHTQTTYLSTGSFTLPALATGDVVIGRIYWNYLTSAGATIYPRLFYGSVNALDYQANGQGGGYLAGVNSGSYIDFTIEVLNSANSIQFVGTGMVYQSVLRVIDQNVTTVASTSSRTLDLQLSSTSSGTLTSKFLGAECRIFRN